MIEEQPDRGPWTCRLACVAGAVRSTASIGSSDVIWTCDRRRPPFLLFDREECEHCARWEPKDARPQATAGPPPPLAPLPPDHPGPRTIAAQTRRYKRGERIYEEGTRMDFLYTTTSGSVKLVRTTPTGNDIIIGITRGISPLNPEGLDDGRPFSASAVALQDTTCVLVPSRTARALFEQNSTVAAGLYGGLCESLEASITRITELSGRVEVRLAQLFLRLARTAGRRRGGATFIPIRLSRQELADSAGTTIETCIRLMSRWDKQRFVLTNPDGFLVSDLESLARLAHAEAATLR